MSGTPAPVRDAPSGGIRQIFRIKSPDALLLESTEADQDGPHLKRSMGLFSLTLFSVGSIIGTGIFIVLGVAVPMAGPAVIFSFILAAVACMFSALSYAELAGTIPISGSSYSYTYATLGEVVAWIVGWCLMLEYGLAISATAVGWAQYLNAFLVDGFGVALPLWMSNGPMEGGLINLPAIVVIVLCGVFLIRGTSESAKVNSAMVLLKIGILIFFCVIAFSSFSAGNFKPLLPLGMVGISAAAGQIFFSFIGFDGVSTAGEEAKNPKRNLPIAIIASLVIVTAVYVLVAVAAIGAQPWQTFEGQGSEAVLATIAQNVTGSAWAPVIIALGAVISIFSVVLVTMYGHTRILFAMGRDGLLPKVFTRVSPRTQTPVFNTLIVIGITGLLAGLIPLANLAEATSIGTLTAFIVVNIGVIVLRRTRPDLPRGFKVPWGPVLPIMGILMNLYIMRYLRAETWVIFLIWMALGLVIYFTYSFKRARLRYHPDEIGRHGKAT